MESLGRWLLLTVTVLQLSGILDRGSAQQCNNRSLDFPSGVHNSPREFLRGNLQLLIPEWRLNGTGFIKLWQAVVTTTAQSQSIEFQLFRKKGSVYDLVYGNEYDTSLLGHIQDGDRIDLPIDKNFGPPEIPINPGYVIGIRLNGTDPRFGLQCSTVGEGVDLYVWRGMREQACSLSLSDPSVEVKRIKPLVSWTFCPTSSLRAQENIFNEYVEDFPRICSNITTPNPTPSVSSTATIKLHHSSKATPNSGLAIATSATKLSQSPTSQNQVTTGPPPTKDGKEYIVSPTTIITLAIMIFLTILTLVLIVIVILLLRNTLRKRNQVSRVTESGPPPPPRPRSRPAPVGEPRQLQTEPVTTIEDTGPVHEVLI